MRLTFEQHFNNFQHFLRFEKRCSEHTRIAYAHDLQQFFEFLTREGYPTFLEDIRHTHLRDWLVSLREQKMAPASVNRKMSALSRYFRYLIQNGIVQKNPATLLHNLKQPKRLPAFLKVDETRKIFDEAAFGADFKGATNRLLFELFYALGIRRSELIKLKETDVDFGRGQIVVLGKGNKERLIPFAAALADSINDYMQKKRVEGIESEYLLCLPNGKKLYENYVYRTVKEMLSLQGANTDKKSPHVLRHTFATHLLNKGANIQSIKELLGHASIAATQVYTHINIDELKKVHKLNHPKG